MEGNRPRSKQADSWLIRAKAHKDVDSMVIVCTILVTNIPPALRWGNMTSYCLSNELEVFSFTGRITYHDFLRCFHTA